MLLSSSKSSKENLDFYCFVTFIMTSYLWRMMEMYLQKVIRKKKILGGRSCRSLKIRAGSGAVSRRYGPADPDLYQISRIRNTETLGLISFLLQSSGTELHHHNFMLPLFIVDDPSARWMITSHLILALISRFRLSFLLWVFIFFICSPPGRK